MYNFTQEGSSGKNDDKYFMFSRQNVRHYKEQKYKGEMYCKFSFIRRKSF